MSSSSQKETSVFRFEKQEKNLGRYQANYGERLERGSGTSLEIVVDTLEPVRPGFSVRVMGKDTLGDGKELTQMGSEKSSLRTKRYS